MEVVKSAHVYGVTWGGLQKCVDKQVATYLIFEDCMKKCVLYIIG